MASFSLSCRNGCDSRLVWTEQKGEDRLSLPLSLNLWGSSSIDQYWVCYQLSIFILLAWKKSLCPSDSLFVDFVIKPFPPSVLDLIKVGFNLHQS